MYIYIIIMLKVYKTNKYYKICIIYLINIFTLIIKKIYILLCIAKIILKLAINILKFHNKM